jgi:hypothetical protein
MLPEPELLAGKIPAIKALDQVKTAPGVALVAL